jgi:hypothetical protein
MAGARGSARRELVSRLLRPRNRRRGPRERARAWRLAAAGTAAGALVLAVSLAVPAVLAAIRRHPYFAVRDVPVAGAVRLDADTVRTAAGVVPGMSIWDVDPAAVVARLETHPWIRWARVRRDLPRRVTLDVREHRPVAVLALEDGGLWYVAAHGRIVAPVVPGDPRDYPFITGLRAVDLRGDDTAGPRALRRALELLRAAGHDARLAPVSEIAVHPGRGLTLALLRPAVPIDVGVGRFAAQLARLPEVLALWTGREGEMAGVDLGFADQIIVRTRTAEAAPRARRAT